MQGLRFYTRHLSLQSVDKCFICAVMEITVYLKSYTGFTSVQLKNMDAKVLYGYAAFSWSVWTGIKE